MRILALLLCLPLSLFGGEKISRRIIAFWDSSVEDGVYDSLAHKNCEMPLNYYGMKLAYYDIQKDPLPELTDDDRGILVCFHDATRLPDPVAFIDWAVKAVDQGMKIAILRNPGIFESDKGISTPTEEINALFERLGFRTTLEWIAYPYDYKILYQSKEITGFEREYPRTLRPFTINNADRTTGISYLTVGDKRQASDLIILSPNGGFIDSNYANNYNEADVVDDSKGIGWYVDPFLFFSRVFALDFLPVPDTTTLAGRRIFHSHCDGDGWNYRTEIEEFAEQDLSCAEVILNEFILPNPDIPTSVGIIAADVDPDWAGNEKSQNVARRYFALPQVESATHTYSHPFDWQFFETDSHKKEIYYLHLYPYGSWQNVYLSWFRAKFYQYFRPQDFKKYELKWGYIIPRAFANEPFNLKQEIVGSADYLDQFAPPGNKVRLMLWSGDCLPWAEGVEMCYRNGIYNYNGGFVRFDHTFPSYLFVSPLGRRPGGWVQTYSSADSEIAYTDGWSKDFFGYQYLPETLKNTGSPRRVKPLALYYHSYSGQFVASLNALKSNLEFIRSQSYIPITISRYCTISEGFYSLSLEMLGTNRWKIRNRKGLQTVRFDKPGLSVDIASSLGVIGFNEDQGALYVYLDAAVEEPIIQLGFSQKSYLIDSGWEVWNVEEDSQGLKFETRGSGALSMRWKMSKPGRYSIQIEPQNEEAKTLSLSAPNGVLSFKSELSNSSATIRILTRE